MNDLSRNDNHADLRTFHSESFLRSVEQLFDLDRDDVLLPLAFSITSSRSATNTKQKPMENRIETKCNVEIQTLVN